MNKTPTRGAGALGPRFGAFAVVLGLLVAQCGSTEAGTITVTPQTAQAKLASARAGDRIVLGSGVYEGLKLGGKTFQPTLVIDASAATVRGLYLNKVSGVSLQGGRFELPAVTPHPKTGKPVYGAAIRLDGVQDVKVSGVTFVGPADLDRDVFGEGYGVFVRTGSDLTITRNNFAGFKSGVVFSRVEDFNIEGNSFASMRSDGIQVAESRKGFIKANECASTRIRDKEHPDCIQLWSRPTSPPTADITISNNKIRGSTQGVGAFNHTRNGVDDGGFDRIVIENNDIEVAYPHGIALIAARGSSVRNNKVRTADGARWQAKITLVGDVNRCGNTIAAGAGRRGEDDPSCPAGAPGGGRPLSR